MTKKPKLGSGKRFAAIVNKAKGKYGLKGAQGLAAVLGRRAHGAARFAKLGAAARRKHK